MSDHQRRSILASSASLSYPCEMRASFLLLVAAMATPVAAAPKAGLSIQAIPPAPADRDPIVRVVHAIPRERVIVTASTTDDAGTTWESNATFRANNDGTVDLATAAPLEGSYRRADAGGLFWSLKPAEGATFRARATEPAAIAAYAQGVPFYRGDATPPLTITVESGGRKAQAVIERQRFPPGVRETAVSQGRLRGALFEPTRPGRYPAVVLVGGSTGGISRETGAQLAARGFRVFALGWFKYADLPQASIKIPLEYFNEAIQWMSRRTGRQKIHLLGYSRGAEAVLEVAATYPGQIASVVAVMPGAVRIASPDAKGVPQPTWTLGGTPLPYAGTAEDKARLGMRAPAPGADGLIDYRAATAPLAADRQAAERGAIRVERIAAPILLIAGDDDRVWPSDTTCDGVVSRRRGANPRLITRCIRYPQAGHNVMRPGQPTTFANTAVIPGFPAQIAIGGTPEGIATAQRDAWRASIAFTKAADRSVR